MNRPFLAATWDRLKNHSAFRVGTLYAGVSWFLIEALDTLGATPGAIRSFAMLLGGIFLVLVPAVWFVTHRRAHPRAEPVPAIVPLPPLIGRPGHVRRWGATVGAFCVVALGMWGFRTRVAGDAVPAAATHMAVLPFHATGSDEVRELGKGMVDLLTAALNDVGGIRTVPGRTIFAALDGTTDVEPERARSIGGSLGAGSVLTGTITAFGANVRLTAEVRGVADGFVLASATVEGSQEDVLRLTDELALVLLRDMWRTRAPIPTVRVASLMTSSPEALKEYLRGEEHLRSLRFRDAEESFQRATTADSSFAFAWLRLAENAGWLTTEATEVQRDYTARALQHADRLPERERSFVRAVHLARLGAMAAFDSLDAYVRRYPDDPVGWYELGDVRYHAGYLGLFDDVEIIQPFLESVRLDPAYGIGLHHVLDIYLRRGDSAAFNTTMPQFERVAPADRVARFRSVAAIRFATPDRFLAEFAQHARGLHPVEDRSTLNQIIGTIGVTTRIDVRIDPRLYFAGMDTLRQLHGSDRWVQQRTTVLRLLNFGSLGMVDSVFNELDRLLRLPGGNLPPIPPRFTRAYARTNQALEGAVGLDDVAADVALLEQGADQSPFIREILRLYFLRKGDRARAGTMDDFVPPSLPPDMRAIDTLALHQGIRGWLKIAYGDTITGLRELDDAVQRLGYLDTNYLGFPWFEYAQILSSIPERRPQGIRMLRWLTENFAVWTGQSWFALARALDASGDRDGARNAYAQVLRTWANADSFRHPQRAEAEAALARLAAER